MTGIDPMPAQTLSHPPKRTRLFSLVNSWGLIAAGSTGILLSLAGILLDITPYSSSVLLLILGLLSSGLGLERLTSLEQISSRLEHLISQLKTVVGAAEVLPAVKQDMEELGHLIKKELRSIAHCRVVVGLEDSFQATSDWVNDLNCEILGLATVETGAAPDWWVERILDKMRKALDDRRAITYKILAIVGSDEDSTKIQDLYNRRFIRYRELAVDKLIEWKTVPIERHFSFDITIFDKRHISIRFLTEPDLPEAHASILIENERELADSLRTWYLRRFAEGRKLTACADEGTNVRALTRGLAVAGSQ
jgi:hypothetical protein